MSPHLGGGSEGGAKDIGRKAKQEAHSQGRKSNRSNTHGEWRMRTPVLVLPRVSVSNVKIVKSEARKGECTL